MNSVFDELCDHTKSMVSKNQGGKQLWIAVAGAPGSGKTTLCAHLADRLRTSGVQTAVVPMDGFHYYRHELDQMPNANEAHAKRGAHWTFNAERLVSTLTAMRNSGSGIVPSFDHAMGDPVEDAIVVEPETSVVLVEGNYLLYDQRPWDGLKALFDETWFVSCEESRLRDRVIARNSAAWGWDRERTAARVDSNDMLNARLVAKTSSFADRVISSLEDSVIGMM